MCGGGGCHVEESAKESGGHNLRRCFLHIHVLQERRPVNIKPFKCRNCLVITYCYSFCPASCLGTRTIRLWTRRPNLNPPCVCVCECVCVCPGGFLLSTPGTDVRAVGLYPTGPDAVGSSCVSCCCTSPHLPGFFACVEGGPWPATDTRKLVL